MRDVAANLARLRGRCDFPRHFVDMDVRSFIEVGVWRGDYFKRLLQPCIKRAYGVDAWDAGLLQGALSVIENERVTLGHYQRIMERYAQDKRVTIVRARSVDAVVQLASVDVVYIDGDHSLVGVTADLRAYWPLVNVSGILAGHDYFESEAYGVKRAVDAFCAEHGLRLHVTKEKLPSWFTVKEQA